MPELTWEGKYDALGKRAAPLRVSLPFQTVETVNESAQERQQSLDLFNVDRPSEWRNRLIWGDKKYVLSALLDEFAGKVNLIYIDPPFATGSDFSFSVSVGGVDFDKQPSLIEQKAYRDTWGRGLDSYLQWFYETALALKDLLTEDGSLIVHLDWHVGQYAKVILDEVFGTANFMNEIVWHYHSGGIPQNFYPRKHDNLFWYAKSASPYFNKATASVPRATCPECGQTVNKWNNLKREVDEDGRVFRSIKSAGKIYRYYDDEPALVPDVWLGINHLQQKDPERTGYPTQKPEHLLERIVLSHCPEDGIVFDAFAGSGTTAVVAEKLGRRWITSDLSRFAIHITRKRLLSLESVTPFRVQNLGKYERQVWQESEFGESVGVRTTAYRKFILDLYRATSVAGYSWLHGVKQGRMVHVGTVDAPITGADVKQIVDECRRMADSDVTTARQSIDILGWDFAFELNEIARQDAEKAGIDLRLVRIPREVLDKRAVEQGDIRFFELAALSVGLKRKDRRATLSLESFVIPLDDVPADVRKAATHWSQWIDYWAVDWDNKGDTFHNEWQTYRTRKTPELALVTDHEYQDPGTYTVVVKVIDILGNDTTKAIKVKVPSRAS